MANIKNIEKENRLKTLLKKKGFKCTPERDTIYREISIMRSHFDADELLFKLRQKKSKVSKGSIYRTLKLLEGVGLIRPVQFTERHTHYESMLGRNHHSHLICLKCGKVIEFFKPKLAEGLKQAYEEYGFKEIGHKVEATGFCKKCQKIR